MTSGLFTSITLESIIIDRPGRQRRELKGIDELAESISRLGLIQPIVVTRELELIAGERRVTAAKQLGWTHISAQFADDLDELTRHAIELEENIKRVDLTWQDQCKAIEAYDTLRRQQDPTWEQGKTAEALGIVQSTVSKRIAVAKALASGDPRVTAAPKFSVAANIVERANQRAKASALSAITPAKASPILTANFNEWAPAYSGPKFNLIHCDFPYGVNADKFNQGGAKAHGGYADTPEVYFELLETLKGSMENVVADSAHIIFWYSMDYYADTLRLLGDMGWRVDPFPLVWYKADNVGILPDPQRGPRRVYETALFGRRGDRKIVQAVANATAHPTEREHHMSEKPEGMLRHFFRMVVDQYSSVLDPTCGSGSAIRAAKALGATTLCGLEANEEFAAKARERLV